MSFSLCVKHVNLRPIESGACDCQRSKFFIYRLGVLNSALITSQAPCCLEKLGSQRGTRLPNQTCHPF